jgi:hypothetical protein
MDSLLLFFREEELELWSIDRNGRPINVNYNSSNKVPLYFLLSGDQILMDSFAKESFKKSVVSSFGDFWQNIASNKIEYERFGAKHKYETLLPHTLKESILPSVVKSHFHCGNLSDFLTQFNTLISFDSFVDQEQQEKINRNLLEIVGYNPNSLIPIDFWDNYREVLINKRIINSGDSFLFVNASLGNVYFHLIGKNSPLHLSKKVLSGKGHDPRVDTILDFLSEIARAKGSIVPQSEIKKEIVSDSEIILDKLSEGYVMHTIKNDKIGINPLKIGFHRSEIDGRLNNRQSLNFIQNEFDSFRRSNNAENLEIILSGSVINQPVFKNFFSATYSKVHSESDTFEMEFILRCLEQNRIITGVVPTNPVGKVSPGVATPSKVADPSIGTTAPAVKSPPVVKAPPVMTPSPKVASPPVVNTPPKVSVPPVVNTPPKVSAPPVVNTPPKVSAPPVVNTPPKVTGPQVQKTRVPPPPPPPPPTKKK